MAVSNIAGSQLSLLLLWFGKAITFMHRICLFYTLLFWLLGFSFSPSFINLTYCKDSLWGLIMSLEREDVIEVGVSRLLLLLLWWPDVGTRSQGSGCHGWFPVQLQGSCAVVCHHWSCLDTHAWNLTGWFPSDPQCCPDTCTGKVTDGTRIKIQLQYK